MIIAVFDDRKKDRDELVGIISSWVKEKGHADVIIRQFSTIDSLRFALEDYRQPDIFFLDIMTPENTSAGFVLAEHIHSVNPQASIIFTTNSREYISNAFEISAFRYLLKPLDAARVCSALDQLYLSVSRKSRRAAVFRGFDRQRIVNYDQILHIETFTKKHSGIVYLCSGENFEISLTTTTANDLLTETLSKDFVRCHQSHIINLNHIISYDSSHVTLRDGTDVPISRKEKDALTNAVIEHYKQDF